MKIFNLTWGGPERNFPSMLWAALSVYGEGKNQPGKDESIEQIERFATAKRIGSKRAADDPDKNKGDILWNTWNGPIRLDPAEICCLDFEASTTRGSLKFTEYASRFQAYNRANPGNRLTTYTGFPGFDIREHGAEPLTPAVRANIAAKKIIWAPIFKELDILCFDVYLIGEAFIDRDIEYARRLRGAAATYYPGKPIFAWTAGYYTWAGLERTLNESEMKRYYDAIRAAKYDGVVVWGTWENSGAWLDFLAEKETK